MSSMESTKKQYSVLRRECLSENSLEFDQISKMILKSAKVKINKIERVFEFTFAVVIRYIFIVLTLSFMSDSKRQAFELV